MNVQYSKVSGSLTSRRATRDGKKWLSLVTKTSDVLHMRT